MLRDDESGGNTFGSCRHIHETQIDQIADVAFHEISFRCKIAALLGSCWDGIRLESYLQWINAGGLSGIKIGLYNVPKLVKKSLDWFSTEIRDFTRTCFWKILHEYCLLVYRVFGPKEDKYVLIIEVVVLDATISSVNDFQDTWDASVIVKACVVVEEGWEIDNTRVFLRFLRMLSHKASRSGRTSNGSPVHCSVTSLEGSGPLRGVFGVLHLQKWHGYTKFCRILVQISFGHVEHYWPGNILLC